MSVKKTTVVSALIAFFSIVLFSVALLLPSCKAHDAGCSNEKLADSNRAAHFQRCLSQFEANLQPINLQFEECKRNRRLEDCLNQQQSKSKFLWDSRKSCLKKMPDVSEECREEFDPDSKTQDTDGDGVLDRHEIWMGTNPCKPMTYGLLDGEQDFNNNSIPNNADNDPLCNSSDPTVAAYCHLSLP